MARKSKPKPLGKIKTKGNIGAVPFKEECVVLSFAGTDREPQLAMLHADGAEAKRDIELHEASHKKLCDEMAEGYAKIDMPLPEQFVHPYWTWRIATKDDINA